jgi:hypothetical protein
MRVAAVLIGCLLGSAALADHAPVIVMPGRADVPVIIDGRIVPPGSVVEGDWGRYRPGAVAPTVIPPFDPVLYWVPPTGAYFPATGRAPAYGRREIEFRRMPRPAESYYRSWTSESQPGPVTILPPYAPPPVVVAPEPRRRRYQP